MIINMWGHAHLFRIYETIDMENPNYLRKEENHLMETWIENL